MACGLLMILFAVVGYGASWLPALGASGLLHPARRLAVAKPPPSCEVAIFAGLGIALKGWRCEPSGARRGTLVYLHGIADNRASSAGVIERFVKRGLGVVAYDSRAHGESGGEACTYGYFEKHDLRLVLDQLQSGPVILLGSSLGAAVALQAAAGEPRVNGVVAAETFSDLRTVARDRVPFIFTDGVIARAFEVAAKQGQFDVDAVSPLNAARKITAGVLLIHGDADVDTPADHSRRVFDALRGPKRLTIIRGAAHNETLRGDVWEEIDRWVEDALTPIASATQAVARRSS